MVDNAYSRVVLFSHNYVMAEGLDSIFSKSGDFVLVARCDHSYNGESFAGAVEGADILLVDTGTAGTLAAIGNLCRSARSCLVALWGNTIPLEFAVHSLDLGVRGIIPFGVPAPALIDALRTILAGKFWFTKELLDAALTVNRHSLTRREGQLVTLLAEGLTNKAIGNTLGIGEETVKVYLSRLYAKLGVHDRFGLSLVALRNAVNPLASPCGEGYTVTDGSVPPPCCLILPSTRDGGSGRLQAKSPGRR